MGGRAASFAHTFKATSYRSPRFSVSRDVIAQSSCTHPA
jgi:hypothetical protein